VFNTTGATLLSPHPQLDRECGKIASQIQSQWQVQIGQECASYSKATQDSIVRWLLGEDLDRFDSLAPAQLAIVTQGIDYQYRILWQRYLGCSPTKAYKNLMQRLAGVAALRAQVRAWVAASRDRHRSVVDVLQEIVQEMLQHDKYLQQQIVWIGTCTDRPQLRNTLMLATIEGYCLRPVRNRPLISYRFVNYLRTSQRGGVTNLPQGIFIKMVADTVSDDENETSFNLIDDRAATTDLERQDIAETEMLRDEVTAKILAYLTEKIGANASEWLRLFLLGKTPEEIATILHLEIGQIYRLREKVTYHAQVFATKTHSEIVAEWLKTSLLEHNLGLTATQWQLLQQNLSSHQIHILTDLKAGRSIGSIAKTLKLKTNQVESEWKQIYTAAQDLRTG
jgi:hypothetical protein